MKDFIDLFRRFPTLTGLLCLVIVSHLTEPKDLRTPILAMPENLMPLFFLYVFGMLFYMLMILPKIELQQREKVTWLVVATSVVVLTLFML